MRLWPNSGHREIVLIFCKRRTLRRDEAAPECRHRLWRGSIGKLYSRISNRYQSVLVRFQQLSKLTSVRRWLVIASSLFIVRAANPMLTRSRRQRQKSRTKERILRRSFLMVLVPLSRSSRLRARFPCSPACKGLDAASTLATCRGELRGNSVRPHARFAGKQECSCATSTSYVLISQ